MKRNICLALAALGLSAALVVPAEAQYSLLLDYSSPDGSAQAAPPQGPEAPFWVRINAVRTDDSSNAVVGDMQFRFHYDGDKVDSSGLSAAIPLSTSAYAAAVSANPTMSGDVAGTDRYRTVLLSYDPTDAPLSFAVGTNRGVKVGDISPIAVVGLQTSNSFPIDVTEATGFGVSVDPDFPQIARAELGGTYSDVDGTFDVDLTTFLSYDPAVDKAGDGRPDTEEGDFLNTFPPGADGTNSLLFDSSSNGISDGLALMLGLDPVAVSTSGDGLLDGVALVLMQAGIVDDNGDLFDPAEVNVYTDTLGDGLPDQYGITENLTGNPDTNIDAEFGTDPASNEYEVATGFDPQDSSSFPPVGDVDGDGAITVIDALTVLDFAGFGPVVPYSSGFPFPSRAKTAPGDPSLSVLDALSILDYAGFASDQVR
jgi:hypothetical protein